MILRKSLTGMALIGTAVIVAITLVPQQQVDQSNLATQSSQPAMTMVIDANTGELRTPTAADLQELSKQRAKIASKKPKVQYSNTMKQYADGTRTGVVDPIHMHSIYASRDDNGNLVVHESLHPIEQPETGAVK